MSRRESRSASEREAVPSTERQMNELEEQNSAGIEELEGLLNMMTMFPHSRQFLNLDAPDLERVLLRSRFRSRILPSSFSMLRQHVLQTKLLQNFLVMADRVDSPGGFPFLVNRWGHLTEETTRWISTASPGDIYKNRSFPNGGYFATGSFSSPPSQSGLPFRPEQDFANCVQPRRTFECGSLHVAIGFVDLTMLLDSSITGNAILEGPFRFLGIEASVLAVAKAIVCVELLKNASVSEQSILEFWFSSLWSQPTLDAFSTTIRQLSAEAEQGDNDAVSDLMRYWIACLDDSPPTIQSSKKTWLEHIATNHLSTATNAKRRIDQVDLGYYLLTGELFADDTEKVCGSVPMFCRTETVGEMPMRQSFLQCVEFDGVSTTGADFSTVPFMEFVLSHLLSRVRILQNHIRSEKLVCSFELEEIQPDNRQLLARIRSMNPYTMSWSNLQDYYERHVFLNMTKACSGPETLHFSHSMNWAQSVMGIDLYDYPKGFRNQIYRKIVIDGMEQMEKAVGQLLQEDMNSKPIIVKSFFRSPLYTNPRNLFTACIQIPLGSQYFEWFLEGLATTNISPLVMPTHYAPFDRAPTAYSLTFSHSPLKLRALRTSPSGESVPHEQSGMWCSNPSCSNPDLEGRKTMICSACRSSTYCSRSCQAAHWSIHKPACLRRRRAKRNLSRLCNDDEGN